MFGEGSFYNDQQTFKMRSTSEIFYQTERKARDEKDINKCQKKKERQTDRKEYEMKDLYKERKKTFNRETIKKER